MCTSYYTENYGRDVWDSTAKMSFQVELHFFEKEPSLRAHDFLWKENIWINIAWNVRKSHGALAFALEFHWFFCFVFLSRKKWKINSRLPLVSRYFFKITVPSNILEVKSAFFLYTNTLCVATKIFPFTIVKPVSNQKAHLKNFLPSNWLTFLQGGISCLKKAANT